MPQCIPTQHNNKIKLSQAKSLLDYTKGDVYNFQVCFSVLHIYCLSVSTNSIIYCVVRYKML
jgi:hypothetical protein